ncbi:IclR family transcriptional regulator [Haematomicrobium sanguinis]|uniref:IclR family transcriptional regulator n=1 Tax=Haematomicrobium sanguinis TaxID=479106 RepID=UPI00068CF2E8|nr:IclR family transcriptional regulator [Haematomicrobium sanguinis]
MQNQPLPTKPVHGIGSLDRGLTLIQLLRDEGNLRVMDAAEYLGVSRSSAHRLLTTLLFRGFAAQRDDHIYTPGPALMEPPANLEWSRRLREIARPHMEVLSLRAGESANLSVLVGTKTRFLDTVVAANVTHTNDRQGVVMPARRTSGGKALLSQLDDDALKELLCSPHPITQVAELGATEFTAFLKDIHQVRERGFGINFEETERGVAAVGVAIFDAAGSAVGAVSVSTRADRFRGKVESNLISLLRDTSIQIGRDLKSQNILITRKNGD